MINLSDFKDEFLLGSLFNVRIDTVNANMGNYSSFTFPIWGIKTVSLPGIQLPVLDVKYFESRVKIPRKGAQFNDLNMVLYDTEELKHYKYFLKYFEGYQLKSLGESPEGTSPYMNITIETISKKTGDSTSTHVIRAVPRSISDYQFSHESNELLTFTVDFSVMHYTG